MSYLSPQEIEELKKKLKEKTEEIKVIYNKLVEGGAVPLPDDLLENAAGGYSMPVIVSTGGNCTVRG